MSEAQRKADSIVLAKGVLVNFIGILSKSSRGISYIVITRLMGAHIFGVFSLCWSFVEMMSRFSIVGLEHANIRFVAQKEEGQKPSAIIAYSYKLIIITSLSCMIIGGFSAPWIAKFFLKDLQAVGPLRWLLISVPFLAISTVSLRALMGLKIMKYEVWVRSLIEPLSFLSLVLIFYFFGWRLQGIITAHVLAMMLGMIASIVFLFRHHLFPKTWKVEREFSRKIRKYIIPLSFYDALNFLLIKKDIFLIGFFLDPMAVGFFAVANEIAMSANKISQAFGPIFYPIAAELHHTKDYNRLKQNYKMTFRWSLGLHLLFIAIMWFLGKPILFLFGKEFVSVYQALFVLVVGYGIRGIFAPADASLLMGGHSLLNLINTIALMVINVGANIILIPHYGILGAAIGTCASMVLIDIVRVTEVYFLFKKHPFDGSTLKLVGASLVAIALVVLFDTWFSNIIINIAVLIVSFLLSLALLGLEPEDRAMVRMLLSKARGLL